MQRFYALIFVFLLVAAITAKISFFAYMRANF